MWAVLRVFLFEWVLARLGLRWLLVLLVGVPAALVFFVGIPTLIVLGLAALVLWRMLKKPPAVPSPTEN
jgi:hypothetical protein